jgi:hypothetical protein
MPKLLAARLDYHPFWYKPILSPPADYAKWNALIRAFAQHLVEPLRHRGGVQLVLRVLELAQH